jgi:hypothetical protein
LVISAVLGAALGTLFCMPTAGAAPVSAGAANPIELTAEAPAETSDPGLEAQASRKRAGNPVERDAEPFTAGLWSTPPIEGLFRSREFELSISEEEYKRHSPAVSCVNSESILRRLAGGAEDCPAIKPGIEESEFFNLPVLAIFGWGLVVLAVAGLYRLYGLWRVRRWLRRMRAQGFVPSAVAVRRVPGRRVRRSGSRSRSRPRRYAG